MANRNVSTYLHAVKTPGFALPRGKMCRDIEATVSTDRAVRTRASGNCRRITPACQLALPQVTRIGEGWFSNGTSFPTISAPTSAVSSSRDEYQIRTPGRSLFMPSGGRLYDYRLILFRSRKRSSQVSPDSESETRSASIRSPGLNGASSAGFLTRKVIVIPPINPSTASCVILTRLISGSRRMIRPRSSDRSS